ncbi:MAG TPA: AraC family transcriptional regulator [Phycisphaerae bacterium]|nr:AraC family transcriptional regulator [Phycisphaerae bacterium]
MYAHNQIPGTGSGADILKQLRPYVRHCGDALRKPWLLETRCLLDYLIVYIPSGQGRFNIGSDFWPVSPHDIFWIPPDTPHRMEGTSGRMHCIYAHFDLIYRPSVSHWDFSIPGGMTDLSDFKPLMHPPVNLPEINELAGRIQSFVNMRIGELLANVVLEATRAQPYSQLIMSGLMLEVIGELLRGRKGLSCEEHEHVVAIEDAAEYARRNCHLDITVDDMADIADLSPSYFRLLFKKHFTRSPREYIRHCRIAQARELMRTTNMTFSQIADKTGFATIHAFSRAFRAVEGITPSQYRHFGPMTTRTETRNQY